MIKLSSDKQLALKLSMELYNRIKKIADDKEIAVVPLIRLVLKEYADKENTRK